VDRTGGGGGAGGDKGDEPGGETKGTGDAGGVEGIAATSTPPEPGRVDVGLLLLVVLLIAASAIGLGMETRRIWRSGAGEVE
jgi:hypothetical protein